jgi:hypothetical protein
MSVSGACCAWMGGGTVWRAKTFRFLNALTSSRTRTSCASVRFFFLTSVPAMRPHLLLRFVVHWPHLWPCKLLSAPFYKPSCVQVVQVRPVEAICERARVRSEKHPLREFEDTQSAARSDLVGAARIEDDGRPYCDRSVSRWRRRARDRDEVHVRCFPHPVPDPKPSAADAAGVSAEQASALVLLVERALSPGQGPGNVARKRELGCAGHRAEHAADSAKIGRPERDAENSQVRRKRRGYPRDAAQRSKRSGNSPVSPMRSSSSGVSSKTSPRSDAPMPSRTRWSSCESVA